MSAPAAGGAELPVAGGAPLQAGERHAAAGASEQRHAGQILALNTLAFMACCAVWMQNGVLVTFLVENGLFSWDAAQIGWLLALPVLTGALLRLPVGLLADQYGGRRVFAGVMLVAAASTCLLSTVRDFGQYLAASLGFGLAGTSFAVGIAYTAACFRPERQGTALGIFGAGAAGAALTGLGAPSLLGWLTRDGLEGWRHLPQIYAGALLLVALLFWVLTFPDPAGARTGAPALGERLAPLRRMRVWRFGLYYFLVFGGFIALTQWLVPYYMVAYGRSLVVAGFLAATFSLPAGLVRALGGWLSDRYGARQVMTWVLAVALGCCALLLFPRMDVFTPGAGIQALAGGVVTSAGPGHLRIGDRRYPLEPRRTRTGSDAQGLGSGERLLVWPTFETWQEPLVAVGQTVMPRQMVARAVTHVYFQANVWIFTGIVMVLGVAMGIGMGGVYKYIPEYFPAEVGVVGGMVGVLGALGGFVYPIVFGHLLERTGVWTSCWAVLGLTALACLLWLRRTVHRMLAAEAPALFTRLEPDTGERRPG